MIAAVMNTICGTQPESGKFYLVFTVIGLLGMFLRLDQFTVQVLPLNEDIRGVIDATR